MTTENNPTTNKTMAAAKPPRRQGVKATAAATTPAPTQTSANRSASKSDTVIKLLLRAKGATPLELIAATDWQPHSVRAFLSGLRKKGRVIIREPRKDGDFAYRIIVALAPETSPPAENRQVSGTADATSNDSAQA